MFFSHLKRKVEVVQIIALFTDKEREREREKEYHHMLVRNPQVFKVP